MTEIVLAALIGAAATILGVLIPLAAKGVKWIRENRRYRSITTQAKKDLEGHWTGFTKVRDDTVQRRYRNTVIFKTNNRTISGRLIVTVEDGKVGDVNGWRLDFIGGFIREGYLQLDYWHPDPHMKQFGSIIYEYKNPGELDGRFVAMGRDLGKMIYGEARLKKQPDSTSPEAA